MAATFNFAESNGAGEVVSDGISTLNYGSTDAADLTAASYPVVAGQSSYEKYIRAKFTDAFTEISNMLFWKSAGSYVTGESIKAGANKAYVQPVSTVSTVATADVPVAQGSALSIQAADGSATITAPGYTKYIVLQLQTTSSTPAGSVNQKTSTFMYDET